jgi:predicted DNA-binding transcriptional regulator AlpA
MQASMKQHSRITPRLIRFRDAPRYLGMDRNRFNAEVRPYLVEIRIGRQGIAFDRLELDAWVEQYISRNGCPAKPSGELAWQERRHLASSDEAESGISTKRSADDAFRAALARATSKKRKRS